VSKPTKTLGANEPHVDLMWDTKRQRDPGKSCLFVAKKSSPVDGGWRLIFHPIMASNDTFINSNSGSPIDLYGMCYAE
jgi:hypothetical protein